MGRSATAPAQELFDLWMETYRGTLGRFWETPAVGPTREKTEKLMEGFSKFADFFAAWTTSNIELQAVFGEANRRTQEKIASGLVGELRPDSYKDFYKIWMDTYSATFNDFLKSGEFASDLGELMSSSLEVQSFNRDMLEENYLRPMNLPTKTEIDELNKEVYALKKAVREASRRSSDAPSKAEIDKLDRTAKAEILKLKEKLKSLEATTKDLTKQVKKLSTSQAKAKK